MSSQLVKITGFDEAKEREEQVFLKNHQLLVHDASVVSAINNINISGGGSATSANQVLIIEEIEKLQPELTFYGTYENVNSNGSNLVVNATSPTLDVSDYVESNFFIYSTWFGGSATTATVDVEVSIDNTNWMGFYTLTIPKNKWYSMNMNLSGMKYFRLKNVDNKELTLSATILSQSSVKFTGV